MVMKIGREVARLRHMTVAELRRQHAQVIGEETYILYGGGDCKGGQIRVK